MEERLRELENQLREAQRRAEEAEQLREQDRRRADEAEEQTRLTTLREYVEACHHLVFSHFHVERNKALTSKGSITNPQHKVCPTNLKPWPDFLEHQRQALGAVFSIFPADRRAFDNTAFLSTLGKKVSRRSIANEKTLEHFLHNAVEDPVKSIIDEVKDLDEMKKTFGLGDGIVFENHPHALSELSEEVLERQTPSPPQTPDRGPDMNQLRPDQICVYLSETMQRSMIFVCEYKAPHKLTAPDIRAGLHPMDIHRDVVNRKTIPTSADPEAKFQYNAEKLTASAITQTYHYMLTGGLEYGLLTTGEAIVFLKVDWQEPETLYYHLAEPGPEVLDHPNDVHSCSAVGQCLAFSLMALGPPGRRREHGQDERDQAIARSNRWAQDFETTLHSIPVEERKAPSGSSAYKPTTYRGVNRSPYDFRQTRNRLFAQDHPGIRPSRKDSTESSDDDLFPPPGVQATPSPAEKRPQQSQGARRSKRVQAQQQGGGEQSRQYCTQKCLLGLVNGKQLDQKCPNVKFHRGKKASAYHPVTHKKWLQLLHEQMKRTLDDGIRPLNAGGTVSAFIRDLQHEAAVYERLRPIQGSVVPVFLGVIDLRTMKKIYYFDHRVYIVHLTCISWGGYELDDSLDNLQKPTDEIERSLRAIHRLWVVHADVRPDNFLFNPETKTVLVIDFERSLLLQPPVSLVPKKRAGGTRRRVMRACVAKTFARESFRGI
ncbi:Meiotic driver SPOK2-like protein [Cladobotryum mycophilum]|uniref:Meiotic driver SPOK2-like protein n=1 Tax=Cladobotryum mycophilum TaxID=491253 RepID=A0ABR0T493_9HYPO